MKILWVTNMPTIYRVNFFNELGKYCNLHVVFERYSATGIKNKWNDKLAENFKFKFLKSKNFGREGSFSIDLLKENSNEYDLTIISSYSSPTEMLFILKLLITRKKFVLAVDGGIIKEEKKIIKLVKKIFIGSASWWLSTSEETDKYLEYYGANRPNIFRYPFTSLNKSDLLPEVLTQKKKNDIKYEINIKEKYNVLCVGQFIPRKGIDTLIKAGKHIDNSIGIYIVGGDPSIEYKELVDSLNLQNVHFVGFKSKKELADYYKSADLFVLPTREDVWGLVINEALANTLPVITTTKCIAGLELIKNGENGYIIPPDDPENLAYKIMEIFKNKDLQNKMSFKSYEKIQNYTLENMAETHFEIFNYILEKKN